LRQPAAVLVSRRPTKIRRDDTSGEGTPNVIFSPYELVLCLVAAFVLAAVIGLGSMLKSGSSRPDLPSVGAPAGLDASRFVLNALFVPALDSDALPLRWVDARPALQCAPDSAVRVNGEPLQPGALVPGMPFELEWHAQGCRPFGRNGVRLDGRLRLTVYREDWGFSAIVEPSGLRATSADGQTTLIRAGVARVPQTVEFDEP
jgi:hypothetical protein